MSRIYLDHNATSPLRPEAFEAMRSHLEGPASNPSSVHAFGHAGRMAVERAREAVTRLLGARPGEILFTAGGTEANNLAIYGAVRGGAAQPGGRIVTTAIEHPSVLEPIADLEARGFEVVRVRPDRGGVVPAGAVLEASGPGTILVSVMLANNETGAIQPVEEIGHELRRRGILFHCDAAQAAGRIPVQVSDLGVDCLSIAAHKFGGPPGVGALFVRRGVVLRPHLRGGGQELNRRPGTENVPALAGCGAAASAAAAVLASEARRIAALRDRLEGIVRARLAGVRVNGADAPRVPNTSSLACDGVSGEILVVALDLEGVAVSAGSACSAGTIRRSHVLEAMGLGADAGASIRVSLGPQTTVQDIEAFIAALGRVLDRVRAAAHPVGVQGPA